MKNNCWFSRKISLAEWDRFTADIIESANKVLVEGRPIRAYFDKCLSKMVEDLVAQSNAVNQAFRLRCDEYREVIDKLNKQKVDVRMWLDQLLAVYKQRFKPPHFHVACRINSVYARYSIKSCMLFSTKRWHCTVRKKNPRFMWQLFEPNITRAVDTV